MNRVAAAALVALMGLVACRGPAPAPIELRPLSPDDPRPASLLKQLRARAGSIDGMRGQAKFSLDSPELEFRRPQRVAALRTRALRVETLGLFGQVAAILVTNGGRYQFYDASSNELEEGVVDRALLWELVRIDLDHGDVVDLLLGGASPPETRSLGPAYEMSNGRLRLTLEDAGRPVEWLDFDAEGRLRRIERVPGGDPFLAWQARLDDYRPEAGGSGVVVAHELSVRIPVQETEARFAFREVALNPELPEQVFELRGR